MIFSVISLGWKMNTSSLIKTRSILLLSKMNLFVIIFPLWVVFEFNLGSAFLFVLILYLFIEELFFCWVLHGFYLLFLFICVWVSFFLSVAPVAFLTAL